MEKNGDKHIVLYSKDQDKIHIHYFDPNIIRLKEFRQEEREKLEHEFVFIIASDPNTYLPSEKTKKVSLLSVEPCDSIEYVRSSIGFPTNKQDVLRNINMDYISGDFVGDSLGVIRSNNAILQLDSLTCFAPTYSEAFMAKRNRSRKYTIPALHVTKVAGEALLLAQERTSDIISLKPTEAELKQIIGLYDLNDIKTVSFDPKKPTSLKVPNKSGYTVVSPKKIFERSKSDEAILKYISK